VSRRTSFLLYLVRISLGLVTGNRIRSVHSRLWTVWNKHTELLSLLACVTFAASCCRNHANVTSVEKGGHV
jgi:hypothetical protein